MKKITSLSEAKDEERVGSKAVSLSKISNTFRVPQGFVVTSDAFRAFLEENGIKDKILSILARIRIDERNQVEEASRKIGELFSDAKISGSLKESVEEAYKEFVISSEAQKAGGKAVELIKAGRERPSVAIRASPKRDNNSSPGIYRNELNVKGDENLISEIKDTWRSFYSPEAIYYREKRGYAHDTPMGIIVQKMVDADKTAVFIERNPSNNEEFIVEGIHGIGKILSDGEIIPDVCIFDRETSELKGKEVAEKRWIQTRNPSTGNIEKETLPSSKKNSEVLEKNEINEITSQARKVASQFPFNSVVEFSMKNGELFLMDVSSTGTKGRNGEENRGEVTLEGLGVSPGYSSGELTRGTENLEDKIFMGKNPSVKRLLFDRPGGIVANSGGYSSNSVKLARELEIPMVVYSLQDGSLQEGDKVSIDGFKGEIKSKEGKRIFEGSKGSNAERSSFSNSVTATEILVSMSSRNFDKEALGNVTGAVIKLSRRSGKEDTFGSELLKDTREEFIEDVARSKGKIWIRSKASSSAEEGAIDTLKQLHRKGRGDSNILFSVSGLKELQSVHDFGLPPSARKGVIIGTPLMALSIEEICSQDFELILINFDELVERMFGTEKDAKDVISAEPFWDLIEDICETSKENGIEIGAGGNLNKNTMKKLIESGIDYVVVGPDDVGQVRNILARVEKKILLEKMR